MVGILGVSGFFLAHSDQAAGKLTLECIECIRVESWKTCPNPKGRKRGEKKTIPACHWDNLGYLMGVLFREGQQGFLVVSLLNNLGKGTLKTAHTHMRAGSSFAPRETSLQAKSSELLSQRT